MRFPSEREQELGWTVAPPDHIARQIVEIGDRQAAGHPREGDEIALAVFGSVGRVEAVRAPNRKPRYRT